MRSISHWASHYSPRMSSYHHLTRMLSHQVCHPTGHLIPRGILSHRAFNPTIHVILLCMSPYRTSHHSPGILSHPASHHLHPTGHAHVISLGISLPTGHVVPSGISSPTVRFYLTGHVIPPSMSSHHSPCILSHRACHPIGMSSYRTSLV